MCVPERRIFWKSVSVCTRTTVFLAICKCVYQNDDFYENMKVESKFYVHLLVSGLRGSRIYFFSKIVLGIDCIKISYFVAVFWLQNLAPRPYLKIMIFALFLIHFFGGRGKCVYQNDGFSGNLKVCVPERQLFWKSESVCVWKIPHSYPFTFDGIACPKSTGDSQNGIIYIYIISLLKYIFHIPPLRFWHVWGRESPS